LLKTIIRFASLGSMQHFINSEIKRVVL